MKQAYRLRALLLHAVTRWQHAHSSWAIKIWREAAVAVQQMRAGVAEAIASSLAACVAWVFANWLRHAVLSVQWQYEQDVARAHMLCLRQQSSVRAWMSRVQSRRTIRLFPLKALAHHAGCLLAVVWPSWLALVQKRKYLALKV